MSNKKYYEQYKEELKAKAREYRLKNKEKINERRREQHKKNPDHLKEIRKRYDQKPGVKEHKNEMRQKRYEKNKEKIHEQQQIWRKNNPQKVYEQNKRKYERYKEKYKKKNKQHYWNNRERILPKQRERVNKERKEAREVILYIYSKGKMCCAGLSELGETDCKYNCGSNIKSEDVRRLTLDHPNGGGREHARRVGGGIHIYEDLIRNNFPLGYRILCMNCQHKAAFIHKQYDINHNQIDFSSKDII